MKPFDDFDVTPRYLFIFIWYFFEINGNIYRPQQSFSVGNIHVQQLLFTRVALNTVWAPYGTVWALMGPYETVWALVGPYGLLLNRMGTYGNVELNTIWDSMTVWAP